MVQVICAGLPKSGTKSLAKALRILGYDTVYDFEEHLQTFFDEYEDILKGRKWIDSLLVKYEDKNVDCVVDMPTSFFFEEMHKRWPKAKVILMLRNEDDWYKSFEKMVQSAADKYKWLSYFSLSGRRFLHWMEAWFCLFLGSEEPNEKLWKMHYRRHNTYVKNVIPDSQLCLYNVKQGWKPLCDFLDKPVPTIDFPFENKAESEGNIVDKTLRDSPLGKQMRKEALTSIVIYFLVFICFLYVINSFQFF